MLLAPDKTEYRGTNLLFFSGGVLQLHKSWPKQSQETFVLKRFLIKNIQKRPKSAMAENSRVVAVYHIWEDKNTMSSHKNYAF